MPGELAPQGEITVIKCDKCHEDINIMIKSHFQIDLYPEKSEQFSAADASEKLVKPLSTEDIRKLNDEINKAAEKQFRTE